MHTDVTLENRTVPVEKVALTLIFGDQKSSLILIHKRK
jgi:hypothetical protein